MNWTKFNCAVQTAGLEPRDCGNDHWQITGGEQLVNCWANKNWGIYIAAENGLGRSGSVAKAIRLAGPPKTAKPQMDKLPASVPKAPWEERMAVEKNLYLARMSSAPEAQENASVGLIRWIWRWIW